MQRYLFIQILYKFIFIKYFHIFIRSLFIKLNLLFKVLPKDISLGTKIGQHI